MAKKNKKGKQVGKPYDDAFRAMYKRCQRLLLLLLNEAFGTNYSGDENVRFLPNETFRWREGDKKAKELVERISDSLFDVIDHNGNVRRFQVECQSKNDNNMAVRIMEYSLSFAFETGIAAKAKYTAQIHNTAVLYLRSSATTPSFYEMEVVAPTKESIRWTVPTVKVADYTLDDLFSKKLYFLLPFYIFNFEKQLKKMEADPKERQVLINMLENLKVNILELEKDGKLSTLDVDAIWDSSLLVARNVVRNYENLGKEVQNIMAGRDYRTRSMVAYDTGLLRGHERGIKEGREKGRLTAVAKRLTRLFKNNRPIDDQEIADIAYDNDLSEEKVRLIAKENGISLS